MKRNEIIKRMTAISKSVDKLEIKMRKLAIAKHDAMAEFLRLENNLKLSHAALRRDLADLSASLQDPSREPKLSSASLPVPQKPEIPAETLLAESCQALASS